MATGLYYYGLRDTTATYATNFLNLIPITTFIFSTILSHRDAHPLLVRKAKPDYLHGSMFLVGSVLSYGLWFIFQVKLFKVFPCKYLSTMLICITAAVQQVVVGLCIDHSKSSWRLGFDLHLITILYSGAFATAATFCLVSWAVAERGPTYPSMFNPLSLITIAIVEAIFMHEELKLGSLIGMLVIIIGLYAFLGAKNKEFKYLNRKISETTATTQFPATNGISNNIDKSNAGCDQSAKVFCPSTVAPTKSADDRADVTNADSENYCVTRITKM
ncbi:hypothetical protein DCAR_0416313 [Daucus carota subsp. sativus]|uniref:WAT1-related protein n=2 Tax=Daucus carota subsp. sativus TaxID=79200 RepID=A0AAF1AVY3_DAUCS|nr:hypothetical protein DCAR_0416313 [Daucus carota subsp. sativus]